MNIEMIAKASSVVWKVAYDRMMLHVRWSEMVCLKFSVSEVMLYQKYDSQLRKEESIVQFLMTPDIGYDCIVG